ncbi:MAG: hydantoinase/oxoprolinase family protein [Candidatus Thorarchaeota archaeon]
MSIILGLDIGGANTKYVVINNEGKVISSGSEYFPIWKKLDDFPSYLKNIKDKITSESGRIDYVVFVTTAELADCFETKEEGIEKISTIVENVFDDCLKKPYIYSTSGNFIPSYSASENWLQVSASNWFASAKFIGMKFPNAIFLDIGSTTTDIIPIYNNHIVAEGKTDLDRLSSYELVYTGALRTNVSTIIQRIKLFNKQIPVASELFATTGDVYVILGIINENEFTVETADGKSTNIISAKTRLARIVCADTNQLSDNEIKQIAIQIKNKQIEQLSEAFNKVLSRYHESYHLNPEIVLAGSGAKTLGIMLLRENGIYNQILIDDVISEDISSILPAYAAAYLFTREIINQ